MDKITKLLISQAKQLQEQIHHRVDKLLVKTDFEAPRQATLSPSFEASSDLSQLDGLGWGLPTSLKQRAPLLFSRLSVYYEAGLLFMRTSSGWAPFAAFFEGTYFPLSSEDLKMRFEFQDFPLINISTLKDSRHEQGLKNLGFPLNPELTINLFKAHPEYLFLVSSRLAAPWLENHNQKIHHKLLLLMMDTE